MYVTVWSEVCVERSWRREGVDDNLSLRVAMLICQSLRNGNMSHRSIVLSKMALNIYLNILKMRMVLKSEMMLEGFGSGLWP